VLTPSALERLVALPWKGNARELENAIERVLALCDAKEIDAGDLPLELCGDAGSGVVMDPGDVRPLAQTRMSLRDLEDRYIEEVLRITGGNKVKAARILGIDRKTLYRRRLQSQVPA
jgi:DNA-binding NtrC family response regulator